MTTLADNLFEFARIMQQIEENGGEITDDILPTLTAVETSIAQKVDNYVNFTDTVSAQIERTKKTIEKSKANLKTLESLESRLKDNVKHLMQSHNLLKIDGEERSVKLVNAGGVEPMHKPEDMFYSIECIDEKYEKELEDYVKVKCVLVLKDKEKFREAVRENKIKSCYLLPRGKYVKFV